MWSALAKAASVAALSPTLSTKQMLFSQSSQTSGAPGLAASAVLVTAGSGSYSTSISSAASCAWWQGLGDDEGDVVADPAHAILHQGRIARLVHRRPSLALALVGARQVAEAGGFPVGAGQHGEHARRGLGGASVSMERIFACACGERSTTPCAMRGQRHVGDIAAAAAHEPRILEARNRLTDRKLTHFNLVLAAIQCGYCRKPGGFGNCLFEAGGGDGNRPIRCVQADCRPSFSATRGAK